MDIKESLRRILERNQSVADLFYMVFLDQYPEVRQYFVHVDMRSQGVLLTVALQLVVQYYVHSFPAIEAYLKILGHEHDCRGVGPELYPKFCKVLLASLAQFHGHDWDEKLAEQWKQALERANEKMLAGYADSRHTWS
jgi:hemoglobin-like flavoprotein